MATKKESASTNATKKKSATTTSGAKTSSRKALSKKAPSSQAPTSRAPRQRSSASAPRASAPKRRSGLQVAHDAARQLGELTGRDVEGVTGVERDDEGWKVEVEVLELRRVPETTDVLGVYEVTVAQDGEVEGYHRVRRYVRGTPGEDTDR